MCLKNLLPILSFVLAASFCVVSAQPQCGESKFFKPNDAYDTNRGLILSTLASQVSLRGGFYNSSVGEGSGKIYAMGMCIPVIKPKDCSDCIQAASRDLQQNCKNQTDSFVWIALATLCFVRHSNQDFFDSSTQKPLLKVCNGADITGNVTKFNSIWEELMMGMIIAASNSSTPKNYAAKVSDPIGFQRIYTLMQCIPGISATNCDACLRLGVNTYLNWCSGKQGCNIRMPVCFFQWEIYPLYDAFADKKSPPPPPPPPPPRQFIPDASGKHFPKWGIVLIALAVLVIVLVVFVYSYCKKIRKIKKSLSYEAMKIESKSGANPPIDGKVTPPNIQVFINFRGDQLRSNFVGHLVDALRRSEINVFIDNQEQRGEDLNTLFKRIKDSGIAIVVFSSRYTESKWCLEELLKIKECADKGLLKVLPIFYKVTPENVKRLKGEFGDNFRDKEHMYASDKPKINRWKEAILFVSHKFALTFDENSSILEIDFIETIVKEVLKILQDISTVETGQSSR